MLVCVQHVGVIPDPEVVRHQCVPEDYFVILATDGVWEFIDSQEAVEIVSAHMSEGVEIACQKLIGTAAGRCVACVTSGGCNSEV
jgi:serine/threonine protein phosphatase PrpC